MLIRYLLIACWWLRRQANCCICVLIQRYILQLFAWGILFEGRQFFARGVLSSVSGVALVPFRGSWALTSRSGATSWPSWIGTLGSTLVGLVCPYAGLLPNHKTFAGVPIESHLRVPEPLRRHVVILWCVSPKIMILNSASQRHQAILLAHLQMLLVTWLIVLLVWRARNHGVVAELILVLPIDSWRHANKGWLVGFHVFVAGILFRFDVLFPLDGSGHFAATEGVWAFRACSWFRSIYIWFVTQWTDVWVVRMDNGRWPSLILVLVFIIILGPGLTFLLHFHKVLTFGTMRNTDWSLLPEERCSKLWWARILQALHRLSFQCTLGWELQLHHSWCFCSHRSWSRNIELQLL